MIFFFQFDWEFGSYKCARIRRDPPVHLLMMVQCIQPGCFKNWSNQKPKMFPLFWLQIGAARTMTAFLHRPRHKNRDLGWNSLRLRQTMLQLSEDEDMNTRITLRVSRPSLLHIFLRILLVTGSIYMFLQLVLDARGSMHQWASNRIHQLDKSLAKRKLLNLNMSETFPTETRTTKQSLTELLEKLFKKPVGSTCADIFDRNLDVPWTTEQASRFAAFQQHLEEKALDPLRKVNFTLVGNSGAHHVNCHFLTKTQVFSSNSHSSP